MGGGKPKKDKLKSSDKSGDKKQTTDMPPIGVHAGATSKASSSGGRRRSSAQSETSFINPEKPRKASTHQQGASSQTEPKQKWKLFGRNRKQQSSADSQQDVPDVPAVIHSSPSPSTSPHQLATWSSFGNTGAGAAKVADPCFTTNSEANIHSPDLPSDFEKQTDEPSMFESTSNPSEVLADALEETPVKSKVSLSC